MTKKISPTGLSNTSINDGEDAWYAPCDKDKNFLLSKKKFIKHGQPIPANYYQIPNDYVD